MIYLALGSNLPSNHGSRFDNIDLAISLLKKNSIKVIKQSCYYETPSYPDKSKPKFINIVISISTNLKPAQLAKRTILVEDFFHRKRNKKNEPRVCDVDIIDYKNKVISFNCNKQKFIVPHKKITERNFVLIPLQEIARNWKHPKNHQHIAYLIDRLGPKDKKSILKVSKN